MFRLACQPRVPVKNLRLACRPKLFTSLVNIPQSPMRASHLQAPWRLASSLARSQAAVPSSRLLVQIRKRITVSPSRLLCWVLSWWRKQTRGSRAGRTHSAYHDIFGTADQGRVFLLSFMRTFFVMPTFGWQTSHHSKLVRRWRCSVLFFVGDVQDLSGAALASWAREANPSFKELLVSWLWSAWNQGNNYGIMAFPGHMAM